MEDTLDTINYEELIKELEGHEEVEMIDSYGIDYIYGNPTVCVDAVKAIRNLLKVNEELRIENENLKHKDV
jgi:hypothetical protein